MGGMGPSALLGSDGRHETDLTRYTRLMRSLHHETLSTRTRRGRGDSNASVHRWLRFPFASISVLVVLVTLFTMSMIRGGWSWSSWTYAFSFAIMLPLVAIEVKRRAVITGGAVILLFFMVLIDAGMPGYLGYSPSDLNWYDNVAHYLGALVLTLFLWAFLCWTLSPDGPPKENGHRKFLLTIVAMLVVSVFFEFTEFFSDMLFGWRNFHPGVDTIGDIIFDTAGVMTAALVIGRHRYSPLKRPFWHAEPNPD